MKRDAHPHSLPFISFRALSKRAPLQVPLIELPYREMSRFQNPISTIRVPGERNPPMILNRAPMEKGARLQSLRKAR
jgi:hypothetical protein